MQRSGVEFKPFLADVRQGAKRIVVDSRTVRPGDIFVATKNRNTTFYTGSRVNEGNGVYRFDSNTFAAEALRGGASVVVVDEPRGRVDDSKVVKVPDGIKFLGEMFGNEILEGNKFVVGITGSTGKSTLAEMVRVALGEDKTYKHLSSRPTPISIPLNALNNSAFYDSENVVLEMPMDGLGQIETLCKMAPPDVGVILNINDSHINQLGSMDNIKIAKMEMAFNTKQNGTVVINIDDPLLEHEISSVRSTGRNVLSFGMHDAADVRVENISTSHRGMMVNLRYGDQVGTINSSFLIPNLALSLAAATAVGIAKGERLQVLCERLSSAQPLPGRMSVLSGTRNETIVDDTRLATPQSTKATLQDLLRIRNGQRMILIQGPVLRSYQHGQVDDATLGLMQKFDQVVFYGDIDWLPEVSHDMTQMPGIEELALWYGENINTGDTVVFKGSEGAAMWDVVRHFVKPEQQPRVYDPQAAE